LRRFVWASAVLTLAAFACGQRVAVDDPPPALYLTFTNLPDRWQVEATKDLTNWFTVILSGEVAPKRFSLQLTNAREAQFYRVTEQP
jgi:hypothetical protein